MLLVCLAYAGDFARAQSYQYLRIGNKQDVQTKPVAGVAMMGGGKDLDEAFRWLCEKGNGGDFLILRARGDDDYNSYVNGLCKANSVATLIIPDRGAAEDPAVAEIIRKAEVVFIAGGDQANYIRGWKGTPVESALNDDIAAGKPIGGTSAGLAVEGEFVYGAMEDKPDDKDLSSAEVLANPYYRTGDAGAGFSEDSASGKFDYGFAFCQARPHGADAGISGADYEGWMERVAEGSGDRRKIGGAGRGGWQGGGGGHREGCVFSASDASAGSLREGCAADVSGRERLPGSGGRAF